MLSVLIGCVIVATIIWSVRNESRAKEKKIKAAFAGRESLSPEEFYERFFLAQGIEQDVVLGVRQILEEQLGADMSCLRAEDDFSKNLGFFWEFDSMADVEIVLAIEEHFQIKIADAEAQATSTVLALIQLVSRKVRLKNAQ